ncbi:GNAT family N-acetyltransferase [Pelagibius sp.]|uniref:GNAT family N-acetyltransferase n=1 Tax=Pelagibius sp. TaxID=1931238 RepID=UPI003B507EB5
MAAQATAIAVREAGPDDLGLLLPLFERFYAEEGFEGAVAGVAENLRQILARDDTAAFVACAGEDAVGAAAASTSFGLEVGLYAELEDLFVDPVWRAKGAASALVEAVADWARDKGCSDIEIVLTPHALAKASLVPWYEARGFVETGRVIYERAL